MTPARDRFSSIGVAALKNDLSRPDVRRRFCHFAARRGLSYEVARPEGAYDLVVSTMGGDLSVWSRLPAPSKLILDFVDSYFAIPRSDPKALARGLMKFAVGHTKTLHWNYRALMEAACRRADAVVCCTEEQRQSILEFCPNVHPILDFQPEAELRVKADYRRGDTFNLVWEGLPQNVAEFSVVADVLRGIQKRAKLAVHFVTDLERARVSTDIFKESTLQHVRDLLRMENVYLYQWNHDLLSAICTACDLAVIPLRLDDPFSAGKSENKLILFWRMGLPVITSATPAYRRAMAGAGQDLTCRTDEEWVQALERLMNDEGARRAAGESGRRYALATHGEERLIERWDAVLASVGGP